MATEKTLLAKFVYWCQSVSPKLPSETRFFFNFARNFNGHPYSARTPPRFLQSPLLENTIRRNSGIVLSSTTDPAKQPNYSVFGPSLLLSNTMSLAPKIDKITLCISEMKPDLACFTETLLHDGISTDCINIFGYNLIYKNRTSGIHGGVSTYIQNSIKFKTLNFLHHPDFEVLWVYVRPKRLPRGVPCIVIGTVYHPPSADDNSMIDYLSLSLTSIEGYYPGCGIFLTGDFNRLNVNRLLVQFKMKQLVRVPTRRDQILDLIITNLPHLYENNSVEMRPPFGLSNHNVIMLHPKNRPPLASSRRTMRKRDTRSSRRNELGSYLSSCDWSILNSLTTSEDKIKLFADLISFGLDSIMPLKLLNYTLMINRGSLLSLKN